MLYLLLIAVISCEIIIDKPVIITSKQYAGKNWDLNNGTFRLKSPKKTVFNIEDTNIATIYSINGKYTIKFFEDAVYKKREDPGATGRSPVSSKDDGFLFEIIEHEGAYQFKSRGSCLEVKSYHAATEGFYISGGPCKNNVDSQLFFIKEAPLENLQGPEDSSTPKDSENDVFRNPEPTKRDVVSIFYHGYSPKHQIPGKQNYFEDIYPGRSFVDPSQNVYHHRNLNNSIHYP